jgi:2-haloacid dehalogenase
MEIKLVTFDVYMAIMDIQNSLSPVIMRNLKTERKVADKFVATWRSKQMERAAISNSLGSGHTTFQMCTLQALEYTLLRNGFEPSEVDCNSLLQAWDNLRSWPEALDVVKTIKSRGYKIAILSNSDQDMLEAIAHNFGTDFDYILSAETAGAYKPSPKIYDLPLNKLNISANEFIHVAGSPNDVLGARASGLQCYWSNRTNDRILDPIYLETWQGQDLSGILNIL